MDRSIGGRRTGRPGRPAAASLHLGLTVRHLHPPAAAAGLSSAQGPNGNRPAAPHPAPSEPEVVWLESQGRPGQAGRATGRGAFTPDRPAGATAPLLRSIKELPIYSQRIVRGDTYPVPGIRHGALINRAVAEHPDIEHLPDWSGITGAQYN